MTGPTTLPDALAEIEGLRRQVRYLLRLLGQEEKPSATGISAAPAQTTEVHEFSEGLIPKQAGKDAAQYLLDLHQMIETVPDIIFTLDLQGNLVGWNKRLQIVTGFTPQELNARPALSFVPEDEHVKTAAAIRRAFEDGYAELEGHLLTKDGRTIPYHWTGAALKNEAGRVIGITGVGRDVSETRRIQAELQRQRQQLLSAQAFAHVGSWEWEIASGDMEWSDEQFRIFGHEPGTVPTTYEAFLAAVLPDDHDRVKTEIIKTLMGQKSLDIECRIVRPTGEIRRVHCRGEVARDHAGHPSRMSGSTLDITSRKQAESALQQSEAHFRALIENSPDIITVLDLDGRIRSESPSFERLLGFAQHEIDGLIAIDFIHPDDLPTVLKTFHLVVQRPGEAQTAEFRFRHKNGSWRSFEGIGRAIFDADGQLLVIANSRDITERKQEEEERLKREALLSLMMNTGPGCITRIAPDGTLLHVNPAGLCMIEMENREDAIGLCLFEMVAPEHRESFIEMHQAVLKGASRTVQVEIQGVRGTRRWIEIYAVPFPNPVTGCTEQLAVAHDITMRKQAEQALADSEARFRTVVEGTSDWMWEIDAQGRYTYSSPRVRDLLGYEPEEILGKTPFDFMLPEEAKRVGLLFGSIVEARSPFDRLENTQRHKDGDLVVLECRGVPILDADGTLRGYRGFDRDVTIQKQAEKALRISEERYAHATAVGKVGVWELDVPTGLYHGDVNLKALFGYGPNELSTDPYVWLELVHPDDQSIALQAWERVLSGSTDEYHYELRMIRKDKTIIWTDVRGHVERDEHGHMQRLIGATVDITERKQADIALRMSQMKLRQALEASNIGLWDWNTATNEALFSPEWKRQLGYEDYEIDGHLEEWESRLHPEDRERALAYTKAYLERPEGDYAQEFRLRHKDGSYRWIAARASFAHEDGGQPVRLLGSHIDITESKRAEETLRLTQFFVDRAVDGVLWVAPDGRILSVNEAACKMLEYSNEELTAMTVHDIDPHFPPEAWPAHWEELKQKGSMTFESKHWSSTGRVLDTEVTVNYLCYGGSEYNCAIMRDVGERKRAEADLRRSHTFLRQVIDADPNFIFAKDREGRFTLVNKAIAEAYGTTVDNLLGNTDADFNLNRDEVTSFAKMDLEVLDSLQERFIPEEKITDAAGQIRWLQTVKRPLLDDMGRATMVLGASTDITARKVVEEELRRRESDLHAAIAERERISEDLHDGILQSIYAIGLGLEACRPLIAEQSKKSAAKLNAELQRSIGQLNHVLEEVRNFIAGLESHILDGQEFDVVLRTMVHALAASYSIPCRVTVEKTAVQHLSTEQAYHVMNVAREALSNCFRHSYARRITLSLKCLRRAVRLSVTDNGVGFNPSTVGGAGHGLANMASRARKTGGNFTLLSKPRGGTKVVLDLPMRCTDAGN